MSGRGGSWPLCPLSYPPAPTHPCTPPPPTHTRMHSYYNMSSRQHVFNSLCHRVLPEVSSTSRVICIMDASHCSVSLSFPSSISTRHNMPTKVYSHRSPVKDRNKCKIGDTLHLTGRWCVHVCGFESRIQSVSPLVMAYAHWDPIFRSKWVLSCLVW